VLGIALATLLGGVCVAMAWLPLCRLRRLTGVQRRWLDSITPADRRRKAVLAELAPGSWAAELRGELEAAQADDERVAAANAALGAFERRLAPFALWPRTAAWLAVASGLMAVLLAVWAGGLGAALPPLPLVAVSLLLCLAACRRERTERAAQRGHADEVVRLLVGPLYDAEVALPRRRRRWRGRRP
jgi:hypothetical protein